MKVKTIVFIHGMYMNSLCWEQWVPRFQAKGYRCLAPDWPGRDKPVEVLRKNHPDPQLGRLTLSRVLEHFADIIKTLDEKPILMGHSMGGLAVQLLLQKIWLLPELPLIPHRLWACSPPGGHLSNPTGPILLHSFPKAVLSK